MTCYYLNVYFQGQRVKVHASQARSDIRFIHILLARNISLTFCVLCNILLTKIHISLFVEFFDVLFFSHYGVKVKGD